MLRDRFRPALFLILASLVLIAHLLLNAFFPLHSESISYGFYIPVAFVALLFSWKRSLQNGPGMQRGWALVTGALACWFVGMLLAAYNNFIVHASPNHADIEDFFYFFYGVPLLLAIGSPEDDQFVPLFFWLDGIQAIGVGFLAYIAIFAVIPFSGVPLHPLTVARLIWIYDAENVALAVLATIRLCATSRSAPDRRFYQILVTFLWVYCVCASIYNHIVAMDLMRDAGTLDLLVNIPFLVLTFAVIYKSDEAPLAPEHARARPTASLIENARPLLLGLSLVALGADIAGDHFRIAIGAILGAFTLYGVRSASLQNRFMQAQIALESANRRLEDLALEDGLTRVANRRCFDQRLISEWNRAIRTNRPLSLLLIDIDHFKRLNDNYGHLTGDECLIQVAQTLRKVLSRPGDLLARYGGEEFVALLPETDPTGARNVATRLQSLLAQTAPVAAVAIQVTISIGASTWEPGVSASSDALIEVADRALYLAKQNGRNRFEFMPLHTDSHSDPHPPPPAGRP